MDWRNSSQRRSGNGFDRLLRELREHALLTQEDLAGRSGMSVRTIRYLESGRTRRPRLDSVRLLADALRLSDACRARFEEAAVQVLPSTVVSLETPEPLQLQTAVGDLVDELRDLGMAPVALPLDPQERAALIQAVIAGKCTFIFLSDELSAPQDHPLG